MKALLPVLLLVLSGAKEVRPRRNNKRPDRKAPVTKTSDVPEISSQDDGGPGRVMVEVQNPLDEPVWAYVECPNAPTIVPIGVSACARSKVNVAFFGGTCRIHHWYRAAPDGKRPTAARACASTEKRARHAQRSP
jgi:hypothetical protein